MLNQKTKNNMAILLNSDFICDKEIGSAEISIWDGEKEYVREVYFSELRIPNKEIPKGFHRFEVRGSDKDGSWATIEKNVVFNHVATILSEDEISLPEVAPNGTTYCKILNYTITCPPPSELDDEEEIDELEY